MENASRALIMAASILLGVMIISVGVALFNSFSATGKSTIEKMEEKEINQWNNNYLKYENSEKITAHDIITVINHAQANNRLYFENEQPNKYAENMYYVQVDIDNIKNVEKWNEEKKNEFLKNNSLDDTDKYTKYFKCAENDVKISKITKRVIYIKFREIK